MHREQQPGVGFFAIGLIGLGIVALVYGDFAMVWQPVPLSMPGRTALAYACGVLMLALGGGLVVRAATKWVVRVLLVYLILWALLKVPAIFVAPTVEGVYLGLGELTVLLAGGWMLFARLGEISADSWLGWASGDRGVRLAKYLFAVSLLPIGLSHLFYVQATVDLVPAWLPSRTFWAYLTGLGQMACGLGVLFSVLPGIAAWVETAMLMLFTLLVWAPRIAHAPHERVNWTAFFISWIIMAGASAVAQNIPVGVTVTSKQPARAAAQAKTS